MAQSDLISSFVDLLADAIAQRLGHNTPRATPAKRKRHYSPEAIERMRAGAKKRWARVRKAQRGSK